MPGRRLFTESDTWNDHSPRRRRRAVLRDTITAFAQADPPDRYLRLATANMWRWRQTRKTHRGLQVHVLPDDWGRVAQHLTRQHAELFAVLNMANAYVPGGGYVEGAAAQEENMFRRTDCHFSLTDDVFDSDTERYHPQVSALLNAEGGRVMLDTEHPRVCVRGPEDRARWDLGYPWLPDDGVFPFYELRAAAQNLRHGARFDPQNARMRIAAQLDTLIDAGVRHAVLSAFGCGAFENPADQVARFYREELTARREAFSCVAFAIFHPGYGPDNFAPFKDAFAGWGA